MAVICTLCKQPQGMRGRLDRVLAGEVLTGEDYYCPKCREQIERERATSAEKRRSKVLEGERLRLAAIERDAASVIVSSTPSLDGFRVAEYLGIESVEFVIGTGLFSEVTSSIADFFGARSSAFERKLREAKDHAMFTLKYRAAERGANAVVGVDLDYSEFSGNRVALIINGTLVKVEKAR